MKKNIRTGRDKAPQGAYMCYYISLKEKNKKNKEKKEKKVVIIV